MREIRISFQTAVIFLLIVIVVFFGAYYLRDHQKIKTQQLLKRITFTHQIAQEFRKLGWDVNVIQVPKIQNPEVSAEGEDDE